MIMMMMIGDGGGREKETKTSDKFSKPKAKYQTNIIEREYSNKYCKYIIYTITVNLLSARS